MPGSMPLRAARRGSIQSQATMACSKGYSGSTQPKRAGEAHQHGAHEVGALCVGAGALQRLHKAAGRELCGGREAFRQTGGWVGGGTCTQH